MTRETVPAGCTFHPLTGPACGRRAAFTVTETLHGRTFDPRAYCTDHAAGAANGRTVTTRRTMISQTKVARSSDYAASWVGTRIAHTTYEGALLVGTIDRFEGVRPVAVFDGGGWAFLRPVVDVLVQPEPPTPPTNPSQPGDTMTATNTTTIVRINRSKMPATTAQFERHYGREYVVHTDGVLKGYLTNQGGNLWELVTDNGVNLTASGLFIGTQRQAGEHLAAPR